jgi:nucleoporin NUP159
MDTDTAFPPPAARTDKPALGGSPFVLGTTFKADKLTANDNEKPKEGAGKPLFGSGFGLSLDDAAKQPAAPESKDEDMEATTPPLVPEKPKSIFSPVSTTPTSTPAPQKFDFKTAAPTSGGLFGPKLSSSGGVTNIFGAPKPASSIFGTPKVKQEDEGKVDLSKIPEAPLPPDTTSKAAYHLSSSSSGSEYSPTTVSKPPVKEEEAPLPPDFLGKPLTKEESAKLKAQPLPEAAPLPADSIFAKPKPEGKEAKPPVAEEAPLPPDFLAKPPSKPAATLPAVPDSAGEEGLSEEEEEEEGEEGEEGEYESEAASEGNGIDVAKDLSPTTGFGPGITPQSSFGGMGGSTFSTISRTEAEQPRPLFSEITRNAPPLFPKAAPIPQSPRSPSPVRGNRSSILRPSEPGRSFSAPGFASQLLGRKAAPSPSALGFSTGQRPQVDPNVQAQRKLAEKARAEEHLLIDPEDEGIQQILQSELEPTLQMHEFLAVESKLETLAPGREEVPGACETLWRDINRMIDRLGLNSRSLQSFILGHTTEYKEGGRHKEDLENPDDWVLVEGESLGAILDNELAPELAKGRIQDREDLEDSIKSFAKDLAKLRAKEEDMRKILASHINPDQLTVTKALPLSAEQATQQNELRRSYTAFSKLLAETEEALTLLKAKIASAGAASGKAPVPTVDAIIRTINKMTSMAEKRSGDIDVLESQMRRLRLGSAGPAGDRNGTPGPRSREGSPFITPQRRSVLMTSPDKDRLLRESVSLGSSASSSRGGGTPSPRKKMSMYSEEEKRELRAREAKRRGTLEMLRKSLARAGPNVSRLRDDE